MRSWGRASRPPRGVGRPPAADGLAADAEEVGDVGFGEAQLTATQGAQAEGFQDLIGQLAGVGQGDGHETFLQRAKRKAIMALVSNFHAGVSIGPLSGPGRGGAAGLALRQAPLPARRLRRLHHALVEALLGRKPAALTREFQDQDPSYREMAPRHDQIPGVEPIDYPALVSEIERRGLDGLAALNGLTKEENLRLFETPTSSRWSTSS